MKFEIIRAKDISRFRSHGECSLKGVIIILFINAMATEATTLWLNFQNQNP